MIEHAARVVLVDDHDLVRNSFCSTLARISNVEVVGDASSGAEALVLIEQLKPNVLITDLSMPKMNGLELIAATQSTYPNMSSLILSMHRDRQYVHEALAAGADGYVLKDAVATQLESAIRTVLRGEAYLSPGLTDVKVKDALLKQRKARGSHRGREGSTQVN